MKLGDSLGTYVLTHWPIIFCEAPGQLQGPRIPKTEIPRKKLKNYTPGPDLKLLEKNSKNTNDTRK